jgi:hypothetical protein
MILDELDYLVIEITPNPASPALPVRIKLNGNNAVGGAELNPKLYERVQ